MVCLSVTCGGVENDDCAVHTKKEERAFIFSSNCGCVTSSREKIAPGCIDCLGGGDCARSVCPDRRELVCTIGRDTSKDSTGTKPASEHPAGDWPDERDAVGRSQAKPHYYCAELRRNRTTFPRGKNISAAGSLSLALFAAVGDQRSLTGQSKRSVATGHERKMEIA